MKQLCKVLFAQLCRDTAKPPLEIKRRTDGQRQQIPVCHILLQNVEIILAPSGIVLLMLCPLPKFEVCNGEAYTVCE